MSRKVKIREKKMEDYCCYDFFGERDISRATYLLYLLETRDKEKRFEEYVNAMHEIISYGDFGVVPYERFRYLEKCCCIFFRLVDCNNPVIKDIYRCIKLRLNVLRKNLNVDNIFVKYSDILSKVYISRILFDRWFFDEVNVLVRTDDRIIYKRNRKDINIILDEIKDVAKSPYDIFYANNWKWKYHSILEEELKF